MKLNLYQEKRNENLNHKVSLDTMPKVLKKNSKDMRR